MAVEAGGSAWVWVAVQLSVAGTVGLLSAAVVAAAGGVVSQLGRAAGRRRAALRTVAARVPALAVERAQRQLMVRLFQVLAPMAAGSQPAGACGPHCSQARQPVL